MSDSFIIKGNPPVIISTNLEFFFVKLNFGQVGWMINFHLDLR